MNALTLRTDLLEKQAKSLTAQCHRAFTEMTKKPLWALQCLAFLKVRLGCDIKNLKCVARLHFSFRRDMMFLKIHSPNSQPKSDSPPAESGFSLCNTTLVYINSHRLYDLPLWQEPYVGIRVRVCVCNRRDVCERALMNSLHVYTATTL